MLQMLLPLDAHAKTETDDETETDDATDDEADDETDDEADDEPAGPRVILRINRPTAKLQQRTMLGWRDICIPPCGAYVDPSAHFRIAGGGAVVSESFELPRDSGDVIVEGKVGSKALRIVGHCFVISGMAITTFNGFMWGVRDDVSREAGLVGVGLGVFVGLIGVALLTGSRTSLRVR